MIESEYNILNLKTPKSTNPACCKFSFRPHLIVMEKKEYIHPIQKSGTQSVPEPFFVNQAVNRIKANPPVIRLAKKLGVDLLKVIGTGRNGHITKQDIKDYSINIK